VTRALEISPLNPTARLAMSQLEAPGRDGSGRIRGLGLSRDSVSLAWSARRLLESGKKEAALRLYYRALSAAVEGGLSRSATPRFADDPMVRRYFLPAEDGVRDIVADLAKGQGLEFREWSRALPRNPTVRLATARLLHELGRHEAQSLLDELIGDGPGTAAEAGDDARLLAARAEALCLRSRWREAAEFYRAAIERVDNDLIRRSWWFNLANVAQWLDDEGQRQAAFRAVLAAHRSDDIARRVSEIQKSGDMRPRPRFGSAN
jgi:tetratricopeptide (TPR) repeat protein